jgi:hypothetical protein
MKLTIELVPSTSWYSNVRSNVSKTEWDRLRRNSYKKANYKCEICGESGIDQGFNHPVECHEIWEYDDIFNEQILTDLISLCPLCHKTKHIGLAMNNGEEDMVLEHMSKVNNISYEDAYKKVIEAFDVWKERSKKEWKINIEKLKSL